MTYLIATHLKCEISWTVLQPGFKKGRVHIIKRALSSREVASGAGTGISPKKIFENRIWNMHSPAISDSFLMLKRGSLGRPLSAGEEVL